VITSSGPCSPEWVKPLIKASEKEVKGEGEGKEEREVWGERRERERELLLFISSILPCEDTAFLTSGRCSNKEPSCILQVETRLLPDTEPASTLVSNSQNCEK
jgi:hypothetical protein